MRPTRAEILHDRERDGGLAAAGFADQAERLALAELEADVRHHLHLAGADEVGDRDVAQLEHRRLPASVAGRVLVWAAAAYSIVTPSSPAC